jgi:micrococcal nuclease
MAGMLWCAMLVLARDGAAARAVCAPVPGQAVRIAEVRDARTLRTATGESLRLAGLDVPVEEPVRRMLVRDVLGRDVWLAAQGRDRWGREEVQLWLDAGGEDWLQGRLVAAGLARAHHSGGCARRLIALEQEARDGALGLWHAPAFAVMPADAPGALARRRETYHIIEGRIAAVGRAGKRVFLNFGEDWRQDVTATIRVRDLSRFEKQGMVISALEGRRVRLRGFVTMENGPMIRLDAPEQIEVLGD